MLNVFDCRFPRQTLLLTYLFHYPPGGGYISKLSKTPLEGAHNKVSASNFQMHNNSFIETALVCRTAQATCLGLAVYALTSKEPMQTATMFS